jgi:hypothetical protein
MRLHACVALQSMAAQWYTQTSSFQKIILPLSTFLDNCIEIFVSDYVRPSYDTNSELFIFVN